MRKFATPDDSALCHLCGHETSLAMIAVHLEREHGIDPAEIADAPVYYDDAARASSPKEGSGG